MSRSTEVREHERDTPSGGRTDVVRHERSLRDRDDRDLPISYNSRVSDANLSASQRKRIERMNNALANTNAIDEDAVRELSLYWENDYDLYSSMEELRSNLKKKALKGLLHDDASKLAFGNFFDRAKNKYFKEFGKFPINSSTKWKTVEEIWEYEIGEIKQEAQRILNAN